MTKYDWCPHPRLKNGELICPYSICWLTEIEIQEILRILCYTNKRRGL